MVDPGSPTVDARVRAAGVLFRVVAQGQSLAAALPAQRSKGSADNALVQELCFGTLRWYGRLSSLLEQLLHKPLKSRDKDLECVLNLGLYQLIYMRVPAHAAVHSTVRAAQGIGKGWAKGLVNGVLRNFIRQKEGLIDRVDHDPVARYSHPEWLLRHLQSDYPHEWERICEAANRHPPMTLRINRRLISVEYYLGKLRSVGLEAISHAEVESAITLLNAVDVLRLPGFSQGLVSVQDAAAQLAAPLLDCQRGMRILDACAAPGGKTAHIFELLGGDADVIAVEKDFSRHARLRRALDTSGWQARVIQGDVTQVRQWWDGKRFDRILLDAPCSATGVIRRHPDIKLLRRASDIVANQRTQYQMLKALWPLLAEGGKLLYVTCSILPEENSQLIRQFLQENEKAVLVPPALKWAATDEMGWQIIPGDRDMDGFYYATLLKPA